MVECNDSQDLKNRWYKKLDDGKSLGDEVIDYLKSINNETKTIEDLIAFLSKHRIWKSADRIDIRGISIPSTDLSKIKLHFVDFGYAEFTYVNFIEADFAGCIFDSTIFRGGSLENANLQNCTFKDAKIYGTKITYQDFVFTELDGALFSEPDSPESLSNPRFIKQIYRQCGRYRDAGKQYYKEMEYTKKKACKEGRYGYWFILWFSKYLFGYGERPWNVAIYSIFVILSWSFLYFFVFPGQICYNDSIEDFTYMRSLYFSMVTFATLGYGDWHPSPQCTLIQILASLEALIGIMFVSIGVVSLSRILIRD